MKAKKNFVVAATSGKHTISAMHGEVVMGALVFYDTDDVRSGGRDTVAAFAANEWRSFCVEEAALVTP